MKRLKSVLEDVVGVAGVGLVAYGAWAIYPPAGFIVAGLFMVSVAAAAGRARALRERRGDR